MENIGILGGSFNPIHIAHLVMAERAREALSLDRVIFIPARLPPHKDAARLANARQRLAMVRLAIRDNSAFEASDLELRRDGISYSIHTVEVLRKRYPGATLHFLVGADTVSELPTWYRVRQLARLCRFVPLARPGARAPDPQALMRAVGACEAQAILARAVPMPLLDVSSSDIRLRISENKSIRYLVPDAVLAYIRRRRLYLASR